MKFNALLFLLFILPLLGFSQIDNRKTGIAIPATETDKESNNSNSISPLKPIENNNSQLNNPLIAPKLNFQKKEFSMFPQEEFGNPGELYSKQLDQIEKGLVPEGHGENSGFKEDVFWGDYRTKSEYIEILYRDYGQVDGDLLEISLNGQIINPRAFLGGNFSGFRLKLKQGENKIEFKALNEGDFIPNTAAYKILDQWSSVISGKIWALAKGVKVTVVIIKE